MMSYEIEYRAILQRPQYERLYQFLKAYSPSHEIDNKDVYFFISNKGLLKVCNELSKGRTKLSFKDKNISTSNITKEIEVFLESQKTIELLDILKFIGITYNQRSAQIRTNFQYQGANICLKHSKSRGYHCEIDITIEHIQQKTDAIKILNEVIEILGIHILSENQTKSLCKKIDQKIIEGDISITPLYILAEQKKLPLHQHMDFETILRISANKGFYPGEQLKLSNNMIKKFRNYFINIFEKFHPQDYFYSKERIDSIHGILHHLRVALYSLILSEKYKFNKKSQFILLCIALFHDIRRLHDKEDVGHGVRAALWLKKTNHIQKIATYCNITLSSSDLKTIYGCIMYHDIEKDQIAVEYRNIYLQIIKTADALDRARLPKTKRRINNLLLEIKADIELQNFAFHTIIKSEISYLQGENYLDTVLKHI